MAGDYAWLNELLAQNKLGGTSSDGSLYDTGANAAEGQGAGGVGGLLGLLGQSTAAAPKKHVTPPKKHVTPNYGQASASFSSGQPRPEAAMFKKYIGQNSWQDLNKFNFK